MCADGGKLHVHCDVRADPDRVVANCRHDDIDEEIGWWLELLAYDSIDLDQNTHHENNNNNNNMHHYADVATFRGRDVHSWSRMIHVATPRSRDIPMSLLIGVTNARSRHPQEVATAVGGGRDAARSLHPDVTTASGCSFLREAIATSRHPQGGALATVGGPDVPRS